MITHVDYCVIVDSFVIMSYKKKKKHNRSKSSFFIFIRPIVIIISKSPVGFE